MRAVLGVWNSRTVHWVFHLSAIPESIYLLHLELSNEGGRRQNKV